MERSPPDNLLQPIGRLWELDASVRLTFKGIEQVFHHYYDLTWDILV